MIKTIILVATLCLVGCSTIPRPDLGKKRVAGKTYVYEQSTLLGKPVGKPRYVEQESNGDKLRAQLQKPAVWTLSGALPLGLLLGAVMMVGVGTPKMMKWVGSASAVLLLTSIGAAAWLMATTWLLALIPLVGVALVLAYRKTLNKKLTFGDYNER